MNNTPEKWKQYEPSELKKLPEPERREKIREFINITKESNVPLCLYDCEHDVHIDIHMIVAEIGIDKAIDIVDKIIEHSNSMESVSVTSDDIKEAVRRKNAKCATERDEKILSLVNSSKDFNDSRMFLNTGMTINAELMRFSNEINSATGIKDFLSISAILLMTIFVEDDTYEESRLHMYKDTGWTSAVDMVSEISTAIHESFMKELNGNSIDIPLYIAALLDLAVRIAAESSLPFCRNELLDTIINEFTPDENVSNRIKNLYEEKEFEKPNGSIFSTVSNQNKKDRLKGL